jgi:hypothetical protein
MGWSLPSRRGSEPEETGVDCHLLEKEFSGSSTPDLVMTQRAV